MTKLLAAVLLLACAITASAGDGYILADYHRILSKGQAVTINLGIFADGGLFLKLDASEYPLHDPKAFKRGTERAMEATQALQQRSEGGASAAPSMDSEPVQQLYSSAEASPGRYIVLLFDRRSAPNRYPIKMVFHDGLAEPRSFDVPPGELQYLQKKIDIVLEQKEEYITRAKALNDGKH